MTRPGRVIVAESGFGPMPDFDSPPVTRYLNPVRVETVAHAQLVYERYRRAARRAWTVPPYAPASARESAQRLYEFCLSRWGNDVSNELAAQVVP